MTKIKGSIEFKQNIISGELDDGTTWRAIVMSDDPEEINYVSKKMSGVAEELVDSFNKDRENS